MMNLTDIPIIDQHAHNILRPEIAANYPFAAAFTEGYDQEIVNYHAQHTLFYRRSLKDIANLFNCEPEEREIFAHRESLGLENLTRLCFQAANIQAIYLDDGLQPNHILPGEWHAQFTTVQRILRLEVLAEQLITASANFDDFLDNFRREIDPPPPGVIGFKTIVCYRTGLNIQPVDFTVASAQFDAIKQQTNQPLRLTNKPLIDFLLQEALLIAAKHHLPVQFHTGFGDPDLDLRLANPLHLRYLLESQSYRNAPIVLLHASYPYTREAGYLASVYPQVYLDFGLAIPFLTVAGMRSVISQLLELTPTTKVMYSSDAHTVPELYYLGAKWGRQLLGEVLEQAIKDRDINASEAQAIALAILRENALNLYRQSLV